MIRTPGALGLALLIRHIIARCVKYNTIFKIRREVVVSVFPRQLVERTLLECRQVTYQTAKSNKPIR